MFENPRKTGGFTGGSDVQNKMNTFSGSLKSSSQFCFFWIVSSFFLPGLGYSGTNHFSISLETVFRGNVPYLYTREIDNSHFFPAIIEYQHQIETRVNASLFLGKEVVLYAGIPYIYKKNYFTDYSSWGDFLAGADFILASKPRISPGIEASLPWGPAPDISRISMSGMDGRARIRYSLAFDFDFFDSFLPGINLCYQDVIKNSYERKFDANREYRLGPVWETGISCKFFFRFPVILDCGLDLMYYAPNRVGDQLIEKSEEFVTCGFLDPEIILSPHFSIRLKGSLRYYHIIGHLSETGSIEMAYFQ
jgi:hypothetical protein